MRATIKLIQKRVEVLNQERNKLKEIIDNGSDAMKIFYAENDIKNIDLELQELQEDLKLLLANDTKKQTLKAS